MDSPYQKKTELHFKIQNEIFAIYEISPTHEGFYGFIKNVSMNDFPVIPRQEEITFNKVDGKWIFYGLQRNEFPVVNRSFDDELNLTYNNYGKVKCFEIIEFLNSNPIENYM